MMTTAMTTASPQVHDAVLALALHRYIADRQQVGEQVRLDTAAQIAGIAALRGLQPTTDLRLLDFALDGTIVQPLDADTVTLAERLVREASAHCDLDWICSRILGKSVTEVDALVAGASRAAASRP